jgi:predicted MFS family arabinose efflux permease
MAVQSCLVKETRAWQARRVLAFVHVSPPAVSRATSEPPPESALRSSRVEWFERHRFLIVFALLASFMGTSVGMAQIATSLYAVQLGSSATWLGVIAGAQSIGVVFMSLPVGMLVDRLGPVRPFMTGTLVVGSIYAILPFARPSFALAACTALISFFMPMRFVALNTVFLQQLASLGESRAGWYRGTHMLGMFLLGPLLGAALVSSMGFAWTYRLIAGLFLATVLISPIVLARYGGLGGELRPRPLGLGAQLRLLISDREVRRLSALESLTQATGAFFTFFGVVLALQTGLGASAASSLISAKGISYITALFVLGGLVQRLGPRRARLVSFILIAASLIALGLFNQHAALWLGSFGLGLGLGTIQIATLTRYAQLGARSGHGKASGLNALAGPSGGVLGSVVGGALGKWVGLANVFCIIGAGFGLAALLLAIGTASRRTSPLVTPGD